MDRDALSAELRACERDEPADPDAMFAVHRHTPAAVPAGAATGDG
jgi:hypothetical protein